MGRSRSYFLLDEGGVRECGPPAGSVQPGECGGVEADALAGVWPAEVLDGDPSLVSGFRQQAEHLGHVDQPVVEVRPPVSPMAVGTPECLDVLEVDVAKVGSEQ